MYKITLFDENCPSCCSGTYFFFVDDLEDFERNWLPLERDMDTIDRYYRSKHGELVTDYYPTDNDEELNIVQYDEFAEIKQEKTYTYTNKQLGISNMYECLSNFLFDRLEVQVRLLKYDNTYFLVGKYKIYGGVRLHKKGTYNRWYDKKVKYSQMYFFGNPIATYYKREPDWDKLFGDEGFQVEDAYADFYTDDKDFFKYEQVESFVWLPFEIVDMNYKLKKPTNAQLKRLLFDLVGEAG